MIFSFLKLDCSDSDARSLPVSDRILAMLFRFILDSPAIIYWWVFTGIHCAEALEAMGIAAPGESVQ